MNDIRILNIAYEYEKITDGCNEVIYIDLISVLVTFEYKNIEGCKLRIEINDNTELEINEIKRKILEAL